MRRLQWFGVDKNGYIFECTSGGIGCVPAFVRNNREETEKLEMFFSEKLDESTEGELLISEDGSQLPREVLSLSRKGIFCFDVAIDDGRPNEYKRIAVPRHPIDIADLPDDIKIILSNHNVDVDVDVSKDLSGRTKKRPHAVAQDRIVFRYSVLGGIDIILLKFRFIA